MHLAACEMCQPEDQSLGWLIRGLDCLPLGTGCASL